MKPQDLNTIANVIHPPIYADAQTVVYAMRLEDLQAFARVVLTAAGQRIITADNSDPALAPGLTAALDALNALRDE
jgi:hypothetical protein